MEANRAMKLSSDTIASTGIVRESRNLGVSLVPVGENLCNSCLNL